MDLRPILSTLRRHKTAAGLIVVEIAIATAIVCNALQLISDRIALLSADSGLPEAELIDVEVRGTGNGFDPDAATALDLRALRGLPGVRSAAAVNQVVYGDNSNNSDVSLDPDRPTGRAQAAHYEGGEQVLAAMGLKLVAGRDFLPTEVLPASQVWGEERSQVAAMLVNRPLAERMFPGRSAVGRQVFVYGKQPSTIVGVVERLTHPYPGHAQNDEGYALLAPVRPSYRGGSYLVRVDPAQRDAVLRAIPAVLDRVDPTRIVGPVRPLAEMRQAFYARDRSMVWLMGGVCVLLLVVTAFGIVGLASFWVQQRSRMIGVRRALGASRAQIRHYFQAENFLLSGIGIAIGMAGAYAVNQVLMTHYELPRLPWWWLPVGAVTLWGLGQAAVLGPARRAAALPPVAVMRE